MLITELLSSTILWEVRLSENFLHFLPEALFNLSTLQRLVVKQNLLIQIPDSICKLLQLRYLDLSGTVKCVLRYSFVLENQISVVPDSVFQLPNLVTLKLSCNLLSYIPESIGNALTLKVLQLDHNNLTYLPSTICKLTNLWDLIINDNKLTELPASLGNLTSLKKLHLHNNFLTFLPNSIAALSLAEMPFQNNPWHRSPSLIRNHLLQSLREICARKIAKLNLATGRLPKELRECIPTSLGCGLLIWYCVRLKMWLL